MLDKAQNISVKNCQNCDFYKKMAVTKDRPLLEHHKKMTIRSNDYLFKQGQMALGIFCVEAGALVTMKQEQTKNMVLNVIKPGHILGTSVINTNKYQHTVKGLTDAQVCFIPKPSVIQMMNQNIQFKLRLMKALCQEIEVAEQKSLSMIYQSGRQRIAVLLLEVWQASVIRGTEKAFVHFSPDEFAGVAGVSSKVLKKTLQEFDQKKWIQSSNNYLKILNTQMLENLL